MSAGLSVLLLVGAYVAGSIPTAYLFARWYRGIDIRQYGSGTVSGSMIWEHASKWGIVLVGLFDVGKATLSAWAGSQISPAMAVAAGLMATIGHNWPVFLRFVGGRGLGCFLGVCLIIFPWGIPWILGPLALGRVISRDSAPWAFVAMLLLPVFAVTMGQPPSVICGCIGMLLITTAKRLEANRRPLPEGASERRRVLLYRLVLDRDIREWSQWVHRTPETASMEGSCSKP